MKDHHNNHQNSISDGEDVEWRPPHILGLDVKLQVALENHYSEHELGDNRAHLKPGLVMMMMQELVNDQEGGPVGAVTVDQQREAAELPVLVLVVEGGQEEHEDDLGDAEQDLGDGRPQGRQPPEPRASLWAYQVLLVCPRARHPPPENTFLY